MDKKIKLPKSETLSLMIGSGLVTIAETASTINQYSQSLIKNYQTLNKVTEYGSIAALPFFTSALLLLMKKYFKNKMKT